MKRGTHPIHNRLISLLLCVVMIAGMLPVLTSAASADNRIVDPSTISGWEAYFGPNMLSTEYAGGVWTDKSVFKDSSQFAGTGITMTDAEKNFLVALSALASTKEITGYASLPTDTMLVLDVSASMGSTNATAMVNATNAAIHELMALSKYNRVGVVLYSGSNQTGNSQTSTGTVILPLDHYSTTATTTFTTGSGANATQKTVGRYLNISTGNSPEVSVNSSVRNSSNQSVSGSKTVSGGTYIQNGLFQAWEEFERVSKDGTVIAADSIQGGTQRLPIIVLMSDGQPTAGTDSFNDVGTSDRGNGTSSSTDNRLVFVTQLTAAWVKSKIGTAYNNTTPLFYTLGLGTESSSYATSVLNPSSMSSNSTLYTYWNRYLNTNANNQGNVDVIAGNGTWYLKKDPAITSYGYVDSKNYYLADDAADLIAAFDEIVRLITLQTEYYPTLITSGEREIDGYITFEDDLGEFMEVKDIKGIVIGDTLFSGEEFAKALNTGDLGTPGDTKPLGDEFVWTVMERLNITDVSAAQQLIDAAYNAGQLSYSSTAYSNYIGWYADADGNYLAPWNDTHTEEDYPKKGDVYSADAVYINRSYMYFGKPAESSISQTDMMHVVVQMRNEIKTGRQSVLFNIPAALIPMVTYHVTLDKDILADGQTGTMTYEAANPIQLVFEVGLRSDINSVNLSQIVGSSDHYHYNDQTGEYEFFTNRWGSINGSDPEDFDYTDPFSHLVAVSSFRPSLENERYYYTEDAAIYTDTNGTLYTGSAVPTDKDASSKDSGYYHKRHIITADSNGNAVVKAVYEPIHDDSLVDAVLKGGSYVIPKGTVLKRISQFNTPKASNATETLEYSSHFYVNGNNTANYTAYSFLGNNGKLSLKPAAGIALRKEITEAIDGVDSFTFTVSGVPSGYQLTDANGNALSGITSSYSGTTLTVTIPADLTVYITGLTEGSQHTITETTGDYKVTGLTVSGVAMTAANSVTVTVPAYISQYPTASLITPVTFTNSPNKYGSLIVSKDVLHPYSTPPAELTQKPFQIYVDLGTAMAGKTFAATGIAGITEVTADANGVIGIVLRNDQSIAISGIPEGTAYTVTEDMNWPIINGESHSYKGYTNISGTLTGTIDANSTDTAAVINKFEPTETNSSIVFHISKSIRSEGSAQYGKDYSFQFKLEQYDPATGSYTQLGSTVSLKNGEDVDLAPLTPNALGTYYYKVSEIIPVNEADRYTNISYDATTARIVVFVTDDNADGVLEYVVKDYVTNDILQETAPGRYSLEKVFTNVYNEDLKPTFVEFTIDKTVRDEFNTGITGAGFLFQLTEVNADGSPKADGQFYEQRTQLVDTEAQATFHLPITHAGTWYYKLTEFEPMVQPIPGMDYDTTTYFVTVTATVNTADTTILDTAYTIATGDFAANNGTVISDSTNGNKVTFTNILDLTPATLPLYVNKVLNGRDPNGAEFTFTLTQTDSSFANPTGYTDSVTLGKGTAGFRTLSFNKVGTYYFVIQETAGNAGGMDYDDTVYHVTVAVSATGDTLSAVPTVTKLGAGTVAIDQITFTNDYTVTPIPFAITGSKVLTGNKLLEKDLFTFELYQNGNKIGETTNNANGGFAFDAITYDKAGTYIYTVKEVKGSLSGVSYDETVYDVFVTVTDNKDGTLSASATYGADNESKASLVFNNSYKAAKGSATISGTKALTGRPGLALGNKEFTFDLYESNADFSVFGSKVASAQNDLQGKFSINLEYETPGKHYYILKENTDTQAMGMNYSTLEYHITVSVNDPGTGTLQTAVAVTAPGLTGTVHSNSLHFTNSYKGLSTAVKLDGTKTVKDKITGTESKPANGAFTFELYNAVPGITAGSYVKDGDALQTKKNDAEGKFLFDEIALADAGTYYFIVVEHNDGQYDIAYDTTEYLVTVTVIDNWLGELKVDSVAVTGGGYNTVHFVNVYDPTLNEKADQVVIDVTKYLDMKGYTHVLLGRDGYEFQIQGINNGYFESCFSNEDGKAFFTLKFTEDDIGKTYTYEITEFKGSKEDIIYSEVKHTVSVTVGVDGADLTTEVTVNGTVTTDPAVSFTNTYDPTLTDKEVQVDVDVTKELINDYSAQIGKDGFQFRLVNKADSNDAVTVTSDALGKASFTKKYTEEDIGKAFTYIISEIDTGIGDIDYSGKTYTLDVAVGLNAAGQLIASVKLEGAETASPAVTFTNEYDPTNTPKEETITIDLTKVVENRYDALIGRDGFKFQLVNKNDATDILYAVSDANGKASFTKKYTEQDIGTTFTYELTEVAVAGNDIDYSTQKFVFVVAVDVNAAGELVATVQQDGNATTAPAVTFTNTYDPTNTPKEKDVTVDVTKVVENRYAAMIGKDGFQFQLVNQANAADILTAASNANGKASFRLRYTEQDIGKTFTYVISEIGVSGNDIDYSSAKYTLTVAVNVNEKGELIAAVTLDGTATNSPAVTFTNTYDPTNTPKEQDVTIDVTKILVNEYTTVLGKNGFKFQLVNKADAADMLYAVSDADGKASFTKKYTEQDIGKTFTYELTEVDTKLADIIYSTVKYTVTVAVDVDAQGKLVTAVKLDGTATDSPAVSFTNTYDPKNTEKETEVKVDVTKLLENKYATVLGKNGFKFLLTDKASGAAQEALSDADGKAAFTLKYTEQDIGKTFTYELTEADTKLADIVYSAAKYTLTVAVDVDADGTLVTSVKLDGKETTAPAVSFTNTYDPKLTDKKTEVSVDVTKILNNKTATVAALSGFKFQIVDTGSNTSATSETNKEGKASFLLTFTQQHIGNTYTYQLTEVNTGIEGMTYDETVYTFTVAVDVDADGKLTTALTVNGQAAQKLEASFTNTYDGPPVTPSTGDNAQLASWILLMILCAAAVTVLLALGKRKHLI